MVKMIRKTLVVCLFICFSTGICQNIQQLPSQLPFSKTFSENGEYLIESYAYYTESPTLKGKSVIYHKEEELYMINRNFDLMYSGIIILSNDGKTVMHLTNAVEYYLWDDVKHVTIYRNGQLAAEYDELEFTGCNTDDFVYDQYSMDEDPCNLFYFNKDIFAKEKTKEGSWLRKKDLEGNWVLREDLEEEELFLYKNYVFSHNDTVYLTDKRKIVTLYDLNNLKIISHKRFEDIYPRIKDRKRQENRVSYLEYTYSAVFDLQNQETGEKLSDIIGRVSKAKKISLSGNEEFRIYRIELGGYLNRNGLFEIDTFHCDEKLNREEITQYIKNSKFNSDFIPKELEKIYVGVDTQYYRNPNDSLAIMEFIQFEEQQKIEYERRQSLDTINNVYIPKDLKDCFLQLDKILTKRDREKIRKIETSDLHFSLGLWIRNNWGLWGGSRLLKYFRDRQPYIQPDSISDDILVNYQEWLNGNTNVAEEWEKENPVVKNTE